MTTAINKCFLIGRNFVTAFAFTLCAMSMANAQDVKVFQAAGPNPASIQSAVD